MAKYLADQFRAAGFPAEDIHVLPLGETAALVVRYRGNGKGGKPILLIAHMDVVTAKPEDWQRDPVHARRGERLFLRARHVRHQVRGRAAHGDVPAAQGREVRARRATSSSPSSGDEETHDGHHAQTASTVPRADSTPEFALNGDGGGGELDEDTGKAAVYYVQGAEKSYASYTLTGAIPGGHSSQPRPDNAIYELADALKAVQAYSFPVKWNDWTIGSFEAAAAVTPGALGACHGEVRRASGRSRGRGACSTKSRPMIGRTRTTCVATLLTAATPTMRCRSRRLRPSTAASSRARRRRTCTRRCSRSSATGSR